jgi:hypothetical protein
MPITIDGNGVITGAATLATTVANPTFTTPNINSAQFATVSGTAPIYPCRAWVNFNGTGTVAIRASGNVTSITDNGTGDYTVNFTTAMSDANYSANGTAKIVGGTGGQNVRIHNDAYATSVTTTALKIQVTNAANAAVADSEMVNIAIHR